MGNTMEANINKISMFQRKTGRHMANRDYRGHTEELFPRFHITPVHDLYEYYLVMNEI